jgi:hypothetical protein
MADVRLISAPFYLSAIYQPFISHVSAIYQPFISHQADISLTSAICQLLMFAGVYGIVSFVDGFMTISIKLFR